MFNWEGYIVENGTMVTTQYPDPGGIPIEYTLPIVIFLFLFVIGNVVYSLIKKYVVKEEI